MLEFNSKPAAIASRAKYENKQPRRLLLALVLLLVALAGVLIKDRQFWFGDGDLLDADATATEVVHQTVAKSAPAATTLARTAAVSAKKRAVKSTESKAADPNNPEPPAVAATRTVLPPLDVEVVAGDTHRKLHPGSSAAKVEISNAATAQTQIKAEDARLERATNAAEREPIAATTTVPAQPADASYPLLAQQMKVQGSVVLQAVIGADGVIENLRVLRGPAILSTAAQQAVREWRFKPIVLNGQAVESKALITVNFTIKVADGSAKTTLAESRADDIRVLSR